MNRESGQATRTIIILILVLLAVGLAVYFLLQYAAGRKAAAGPAGPSGPPQPVYQAQVGDIQFSVESVTDLGNYIASGNSYQQPLTTTEKFIKVVVGAQNMGLTDTNQGVWSLGNIIDSDGRNFVSINDKAYNFLPQSNEVQCGAILKPDFSPTSCTGLYEVAKASTGLKLRVINSESKTHVALLDLNVQ